MVGDSAARPQTLTRGDGSLWLRLLADLRRRLYTDDARLCGVAMTTGEERIRAVRPTPAEQRVLGITADVALFVIERLGCSATPCCAVHHHRRYRRPRRLPPPPSRPPDTRVRKGPRTMTSTDPIIQIDPTAASELAADGALLLDVREPEEWRIGHIADAVHMPLGDLQTESVPRDRVVVAVCRSGKAATRLAAAGVEVRNMTGGMKAWAEAGLPITTDDGTPGAVG